MSKAAENPPYTTSAAVTPITAPPAVTITATDPTAAEVGDTGAFTFRRSGPTNAPLTVYFSLSGNAANGKDYSSLPGSIIIPAGFSAISATLTPKSDAYAEGTESVTATLKTNSATYRVAAPNTATITILDNGGGGTQGGTIPTAASTAPRVSLSIQNGAILERTNDVRSFIVTRRGSFAGDLLVNFSVGGTAANGVDYQPINSSVVIPDGKGTAAVTFRPIHDLKTEPTESVTLTLTPSPNYNIGVSTATATIRDNDVDTDHDGVSDAQEILNGTDPRDATSH